LPVRLLDEVLESTVLSGTLQYLAEMRKGRSPMYQTYAYGHDYGNSITCGVVYVGKEQYALTIPSALSLGSYEALQSKLSSTSANLAGVLNQRSHVIALNGKSYYVGNLAIEQNPNSEIADLTSRGDVSRYWSDRNLAMLLATSGTLIRDQEYGLAVVGNLPIATHNDTNVKNVKRALDGDHVFYLDGMKRVAHVRVMKTIQEGAGACLAYGPSGPGSQQKKCAVVDIGGRTTDAYLVVGQVPVMDKCRSLDLGVETAFDQLIAAFENRFSFPLSAADARALQSCYVNSLPYQEVTTIKNAEIDPGQVEDLIDEVLRSVGRQIVSFLKRTWSSSLSNDVVLSDTEKVLLIGGGAYYFEPDIKPLFKKRLVVPEAPEFANAAGYVRLAEHFLKRERERMVAIGA
jgi:hypothetical protein